MSTAISKRICGHCHKSKPWDEFEQPMLVLQDYRVPWFKDCLLQITEFNEEQLENKRKKNDKTYEERMAWCKNSIKIAEHILKTIDAQYNSPNHWVEIPVNDYERDWLKDQFTHRRDSKLDYPKDQFTHRRDSKHKDKTKNQLSTVEFEGDLGMINHILKIIAISYMDKCKACADMRRYPQFLLDCWKKDPVIVHKVHYVPIWEATEKRGVIVYEDLIPMLKESTCTSV